MISLDDSWIFFVDADPMKGWEHDCYLLYVPKTISTNGSPLVQNQKFRFPPDGNFTPIEVKNRYGSRANQKPVVRKSNLSNENLTAVEHTYAVILSGGGNKFSNHERYWNDCSFVYQTLTNKFGISKENIFTIMSDGTDPTVDMRTTTGSYVSSPLDLDGDGQAEIQYPATRSAVKNVLSTLSSKMTKDDHLFFYVIDHGGSNDNRNQSYIVLWNGENLQDYELADWLSPFNQKSVNVNLVLGQCNSGGFIDNLNKVGCVVATASTGSEYSWGCPDIPYDEFVFQWTSAIGGADAFGKTVSSDIDGNNRVTMDEAFVYAKNNDRQKEEHPQYNSNPKSLGEDLAFNNLPEAIDLYIKDNYNDTGKEPNLTTDVFWDSPSIWVRNEEDGIEIHENPICSKNHRVATIYVRIHNRGKENYNGGKYLHMYWACASTGLTNKAWKGQEEYINNQVTGGRMNPEHIEPIKAGDSLVVLVTWALPRGLSSQDNGTEKHHFCLLGQISDEGNPELEGDYPAVSRSNDIAQKNVSIIAKEDVSKGTAVFVRNIYKDDRKYSLEIRPHTYSDKQLFERAKVTMELARPIYNAWQRGGLHANNINYVPSESQYQVELKSEDSKMEDICMNGSEFEKVTMKFDFNSPALSSPETYTFDLIQRDDVGNIVGGETFIVEAPIMSSNSIDIHSTELEGGKYRLSTSWQDSEHSIRWIDGNGREIGNTDVITVTPTFNNNKFSAIALNSHGEMAQESITLDSKIGLKSLTPASVEDYVDVELYGPVVLNGTMLQISSLTQGMVMLTKNVPVGTTQIRLNTASLPSGIYSLTYSVNDKKLDSKIFMKK